MPTKRTAKTKPTTPTTPDMTKAQAEAARALAGLVLETVSEVTTADDKSGVALGTLYAGMMHVVSLDIFNKFVESMLAVTLLVKGSLPHHVRMDGMCRDRARMAGLIR